MTSYLVLNVLFLLTLFALLPKKLVRPPRAWWLTLAIIVGLTAVFDPIIITLGIVAYDPTKLSGIYWFGAPVEDFFYAMYAVAVIPLLWNRLGARRG